MTDVTYIPINPITIPCPKCRAKAGKPCQLHKRELELVHVARIHAAAKKDVAAKKSHDAKRAD